jgi:hypothetical protein
MTMRQRADDGNGIPVLGNDGAAFEQCLEPGDPLVRPVGEVQERALLDLAGLAVALAQQLMEAQNHNITWLQSTNQTEIMPRYQSLDSRERGKRRLRSDATLACRSARPNRRVPHGETTNIPDRIAIGDNEKSRMTDRAYLTPILTPTMAP